ncbi:hypothetical protein Oweho_2412 [Owenweeksia hongkongensis DSM 17368]|uniref:Uncharacterized protein n=1 Tax=Owenweeksia hongkongensis (strain DSM 17368 / CIP 108786 / JCM 12287 / NRRL B-23963 / UST20020801) TaxID=926562 RepID=G8R717_OWEHD|nr:hypothetical protein [Owenweeksia hongkongensis]AEV33382.1 hypothetical protein Oweho_2412 [Owenweeksia hongkongensis DSM 17368]
MKPRWHLSWYVFAILLITAIPLMMVAQGRTVKFSASDKFALTVTNQTPATLTLFLEEDTNGFKLRQYQSKEIRMKSKRRKHTGVTVVYLQQDYLKDIRDNNVVLQNIIGNSGKGKQFIKEYSFFYPNMPQIELLMAEYGLRNSDGIKFRIQEIMKLEEMYKSQYKLNDNKILDTLSYKSFISKQTITPKTQLTLGFPFARVNYNEIWEKGYDGSGIAYDVQLSYMILGDYKLLKSKTLWSISAFVNWNSDNYGLNQEGHSYYAGAYITENSIDGTDLKEIVKPDYVNLNIQKLSAGAFLKFYMKPFYVDVGGGWNAYTNAQLRFNAEQDQAINQTHAGLNLRREKFNKMLEFTGPPIYGVLNFGIIIENLFIIQLTTEYKNESIVKIVEQGDLYYSMDSGSTKESVSFEREKVMPINFRIKFGLTF